MRDLISEWDAKNTDFIASIYQKFESDDGFLDDLILFMNDVSLQRGASWLIKHYIDGGGRLSGTQVEQFIKLINKLDHWETKLHFLQILPTFIILEDMKRPLFDFLFNEISSDAKFVRAWSYGGLIVLSDQHEEYRDQAMSYLKTAMENEAASIKARIRQAAKKSKYWKVILL